MSLLIQTDLKQDQRGELERKFWSKVIKSSGCWIWNGAKFTNGYGAFSRGRKLGLIRAHRFSYMLAHGNIPNGLCVLHSCDVPTCVNPGHLWLGTDHDNSVDRGVKGRTARGSKINKSKLHESQVLLIRNLRHKGISPVTIGKQFGVSRKTIWSVTSGKTWLHVATS